MAKRGRKIQDKVYRTLGECLSEANNPLEKPYEVDYKGEKYYVCTSSTANAVRIVAYFIGFIAKPIGVQAVITWAQQQ